MQTIYITPKEAIELFNLIVDDIDKEKEKHFFFTPEKIKTQEELYDQLSCGRTTIYITYEQLNKRMKKLLSKVAQKDIKSKKCVLFFTCEKEVYPPIFIIGAY